MLVPSVSMETSSVRVFISYSRDSDEHIAWVTRLANVLEERPEFHVVFDGYDLLPGSDVTHFMDDALRSDRVVVVVTPGYVDKATARSGGVGYESSVISEELLRSNLQDTFVPILRLGTNRPTFLRSKLYVDFRSDEGFNTSVRELADALLRKPRVARPAKRRADVAPAFDNDGVGTALNDRYVDVRSLQGSVRVALYQYAHVVQALIRAGRWSTVIGVAEPSELTHAEAQARRAIRLYHSKVVDATATTRHVLASATASGDDGVLLQEMSNVLGALQDQLLTVEREVPEIRRGLSWNQLFSKHGDSFEDLELRFRELLRAIYRTDNISR